MKKLFFVILVCCVALNINAQQLPFRVNVDFSSFRYDSANSYVEIYLSVPSEALTYKKTNDKYIGAVFFSFNVMNNDSIESSKSWTLQNSFVDSLQIHNGQFMLDAVGLVLRPGNHSLKLLALDYNNTSTMDSNMFPLNVTNLSVQKMQISDVELCSNITKAETEEEKQSPFYKSTYLAYPNPSGLFGSGLPTLFYFSELYNLLTSNSNSDYTVITSVRNAVNNEVIHHEKKKKRSVNNAIEIGTLNVSALKSGTYIFTLGIIDGDSISSSSKKFFVYNPTSGVDSTMLQTIASKLENEFAALNNEQLDEQFAMAKYIASEIEKNEYEKLKTVETKKVFLTEFWKRRALDSGNSFRKEYLKRIDYTNEHYSTSKVTKNSRLGWKTDKGRVYIIYGEPDEIKRRPDSQYFGPYEIWEYNQIQGGVSFYFVDEFRTNQWRLVHSTARSESQDPQWFNKIQDAEASH